MSTPSPYAHNSLRETLSRDFEPALPPGLTIPRDDGNRRAHDRLDVRLPMIVACHALFGDQGLAELPGVMRDLSAGGVRFATRVPLGLGDRARVEIVFPTWVCETRIAVRYMQPLVGGAQLGCEFLDLSRTDLAKVREELEQLQVVAAREHLQVVDPSDELTP